MVTVTTSKGKTYEAEFAWAPITRGRCMIRISDDRRLPVIAEEFDGLEHIHMSDPGAEREYDWDGYNRLVSIVRMDSIVDMELIQEAGNGAV